MIYGKVLTGPTFSTVAATSLSNNETVKGCDATMLTNNRRPCLEHSSLVWLFM